MSTVNFTLPAKTWVAITSTDKDGSVLHRKGLSNISYVEAASTPADFTGESPVVSITSRGDLFYYRDIPAADFIYAWSDDDAIVSVTPGA